LSERARITIDVVIDGDRIDGEASDGSGAPERFSGWLELIASLDRLLEARRQARPCVCVAFDSEEAAQAFAGSPELGEALRRAGATEAPHVALVAPPGSPEIA
jgi:hypothetical protein